MTRSGRRPAAPPVAAPDEQEPGQRDEKPVHHPLELRDAGVQVV